MNHNIKKTKESPSKKLKTGEEAALKGAERYKRLKMLGEGQYGKVYLAKDMILQREVAVKKIKRNMANYADGIHWTALREIKLLKKVDSENVVTLLDVFIVTNSVCLVFELGAFDLENVIRSSVILKPGDIKAYMEMILKGLKALHDVFILHRDMKPGNVLIAPDGNLKLTDFGLARVYGSPNRLLTSQVCTIAYRAPELLFGANEYGVSIDIWATGCIFAELIIGTIFLPGRSEIDQLGKIFHMFGTPKEEDWPEMTSLPSFLQFNDVEPTSLKDTFPSASKETLDLFQKMFYLNPNKRLTAQEALNHDYFLSELPLATPLVSLPKRDDVLGN